MPLFNRNLNDATDVACLMSSERDCSRLELLRERKNYSTGLCLRA